MAAPHVAGAIGLIGQAFRQERGRVPRPAEIIDILERSANTTKLPGWEAEEQGAGRLDVHQAVRLAKGDITLRRPNFGHPVPPYIVRLTTDPATNLTGCTGTVQLDGSDGAGPGRHRARASCDSALRPALHHRGAEHRAAADHGPVAGSSDREPLCAAVAAGREPRRERPDAGLRPAAGIRGSPVRVLPVPSLC